MNELLNDSYKVLNILYDNQITINNETYCPLSQDANFKPELLNSGFFIYYKKISLMK